MTTISEGTKAIKVKNGCVISPDVLDPPNSLEVDNTSIIKAQFGNYGTPANATPGTFIYDSTQESIYGDLYPTWATTLAAAINYGGLAHIHIQNGSIIPAGAYTTPPTWDLTVDSFGTTILPGTSFTTSPATITALHNATINGYANSGASVFPLTNPTITFVGVNLVLGATGNLIDATSNSAGVFALDSTSVSGNGMTFIKYP